MMALRCSSGTKTLVNAVMTVAVGASSSWIVAARFDPEHYGSWWRPLALALAVCIVQTWFAEFVQTPGDRLAVQV